ncbi:MAG: GNAT family N-acetyltransferase [Pseudomonadota bacterium]
MIDIRQVDESLARELSELCANSFAGAYHGVNSQADIEAYCEKNYSIAKVKANLSNPDVLYKVSYRDSKAVGFFMVQNQQCPKELDGNVLELKQIYVLASEFGTGLGKQLLDAVIHYANQQHKKWIWLSVSDLNARAQSFYLKHGFEKMGTAPLLEVGSDRLPATLMALRLAGDAWR